MRTKVQKWGNSLAVRIPTHRPRLRSEDEAPTGQLTKLFFFIMLFIVVPNTLCLADTSCYFSTEGHRKREKHYHLLAHMYSPSIIKIALVVGSHLADTLRFSSAMEP